MPMDPESERELNAYLARIRKTIADSQALVSQAELRMAETDRFLEQQGLTREQVLAMRFTDEQRQLVNAELARQGLPPLDETDFAGQPGEESLASDFHPMGAGASRQMTATLSGVVKNSA